MNIKSTVVLANETAGLHPDKRQVNIRKLAENLSFAFIRESGSGYTRMEQVRHALVLRIARSGMCAMLCLSAGAPAGSHADVDIRPSKKVV